MARTYARAENSRGREVTAAGGKRVTFNGWDVGVMIEANPGKGNDPVVLTVSMTHGSSRRGMDTVIGTVRLIDGKPVFSPADEEPTGDAMTSGSTHNGGSHP